MKERVMMLSDLQDFSGIDKSNEISLFEYGLLCKKESDNILCWVGVETDIEGYWGKFESFHTSEKDLKDKMNEEWFNKKCFLEYVDQTEEEFLASGFINQIHSMLQYWGYENIFGSSYNPVFIENW